MEREMENRKQQLEEYKRILKPLLTYLPWLEKNVRTSVSHTYDGSEVGACIMGFPVYDSTLMSFIREASRSELMDRNYRYVYTRGHIKTHDQERRAIASATIKEWNVLCGVLSNYVLGGRTRSVLWSEGVSENIFYLVLSKMQEITEIWD